MKKYIKPTTTSYEIECEQMIAASITIDKKEATGDACSKGHTFENISDWDDIEE